MVRNNARFLNKVFDSITDPLVIYGRDNRIVLVNQATGPLFHHPAEAMGGQHCYEVFHGRRTPCEECHVQEVFRTGAPHRREKLIPLPDGRRRHFELYCYPIRDAQGHIVQVIEHGRDITERKDLEGRLKASEEKYRTIVELAREGIIIVDTEARVTFANRFFTDLLGYRSEEVIGRSVYDFMDQEARQIVTAQFERRRQGLADVYELPLRKKDGRPLTSLIAAAPLMDNGAFLGAVSIVTDISPLKQVESELRTAKEFNDKVINSITDNLVVMDPHTFRIVQANDSFLARVGLERSAALGRPCFEIMLGRSAPCELNGTRCPVQETARQKAAALVDRVYPDAQGRERLLQIAAYPFFDDQGEVELVIRLERDVTEPRRMEEALAFRSRELQKTQHQLETLFEISRQVSAKGSLGDLIDSLQDITRGIFPDTDPLFLILDANRTQFLHLAESLPHVVEQPGLVADFIRYLGKPPVPPILRSADTEAVPPFLKIISEIYAGWFGLPIAVQEQCIGYFLLGSKTARDFAQVDIHFLQALLAQIAGHLRALILHEAEIDQLRQQVTRSSHGELIGQSKKMHEVYELIDLVAGSDATVLITGENGTGKELVAQAIHRHSHRGKGAFVVANCSAYSPTLLESELFGHEKGAFTGAIRQKKGRIERAHGGTLFLDEIGDISPATQVLLLRFLQDHFFERVGGERAIEANVRVLAATNQDLQKAAEAGRFRDDLYYRLNVIAIHLPSLKERKDDIPLLCRHFLNKYNLKERKKIHKFSANTMQVLMDYDWPGNVRQLENAVSHAVILAQGEVIRRKHLPRFLRETPESSISASLADNERRLILKVLQESNWNKHDAARRLQLSRSTLYSKIRRYGLEKPVGTV